MAQVGDYIGNYRLVEVVNSGTFGQVFRAEHRWLTGRQVAIKFLRLERLHNPHEREQFLHEARILNQLKHPAILPILDFGLENEFPYIITEYASGGTLRAYLRKDAGKPLDLADVLRIIVPIGEALQYAHENRIVHRDLKPENILFDAHNRPLLADFGIAIVLTTNTSYLGSIGGTAPYMAPEQFKGKAYPESDQYASGCLLYEMLTGRRPFQAPDAFALGFLHVHEPPTPPRQLNPCIPEYINDAVLKAMAKERSERHTNMITLLDALRVQPESIAPETPTQPLTHSQTQQPSGTGASKSPQMVPSAIPPGIPGISPSSAVQPRPSFTTIELPSASISMNYPNTYQSAEILSAQGVGDSQKLVQLQPIDPFSHAMQRAHQRVQLNPSLSGESEMHREQLVHKISGAQSGPRAPTPLQPGVSPKRIPSRTITTPQISAPPTRIPTRRSRKRRVLLLSACLAIITLLVVGGIISVASSVFNGLILPGHLTATVIITPESKVVQNDYLIAGVTTPTDAGQRQISARVLKATSDTKSATNSASGSIPAIQATGILVFINTTASAITIAKTVLTGDDGVQVTFNGAVFVPATGSASASVNAYAIQSGQRGNIPAFDIAGLCCFAGISVKNPAAFHGGQDAQPNGVIQQSDIDSAAKSLSTQLTTSTQAALRKQVQSNERVVDGSFQCNQTTTANHKAGEQAPSVTVSVFVACSEEVFDFAGAQRMTSSLLMTNLPSGVDLTGYKPVGQIITSLVSATVVSGENQLNVNMQAAARWVYQFGNQEQQQIRQALVKLSKTNALRILKQYAGLSSANVSISSGSIMPAIAIDIAVNIVAVPGLSPGAPATPYVSVGTPSGGGTPNEGS